MPPAKPLKLRCLRAEARITTDGQVVLKPMLVGFAPVSDLRAIAKAPAFSDSDTNKEIAEMLQKLPVKKWQRPLDQPRIVEMSRSFGSRG